MQVRSRRYPDSGTRTPSSPFGRLIEIVRENDRLFGELDGLDKRLGQARGYAEDPQSSPTLAATLLRRARTAYAAVLEELKANRIEALAILRGETARTAPRPPAS